MFKKIAVLAAAPVFAVALTAGSAWAASNPNGTGQPSQSCQAEPNSPPGFNSGGFANAEQHYAGTQPQNSKNPKSVSQYDVACYQVSQH